MKDAPRLSGFTACKPAESWRCQRQSPLRPVHARAGGHGAAGLSPTGGRAGRFGAAVRGGPCTGQFRGRSNFHTMRVVRSAMEN